MNPRDFTGYSTQALLESLKDLADDLSEDPRSLIIEAMDRIELLSIESEDLSHGLTKARQESKFWMQTATNAVNRNKRLEEAGDAMVLYATTPTKTAWKEAKEGTL